MWQKLIDDKPDNTKHIPLDKQIFFAGISAGIDMTLVILKEPNAKENITALKKEIIGHFDKIMNDALEAANERT